MDEHAERGRGQYQRDVRLPFTVNDLDRIEHALNNFSASSPDHAREALDHVRPREEPENLPRINAREAAVAEAFKFQSDWNLRS